jgi:tRNA threonylcarbamoyladenosine biosynthesis protein TsaB
VLVLALDASTGIVTTAVAREGERVGPEIGREVLAEISVSSHGASEALLPAVHTVLRLAGADLGDIERILVGVGPGTFTGIRIALTTARALALATGVALSKNTTLAALAAPSLLSMEKPSVLAVLDAKRRQVFTQRFTGDGEGGEIWCTMPKELRMRLATEEAQLIVGDGAVRYREMLSGLGYIPSDDSPLHRVTATGHVLSANLALVPLEEVVPLYVREPDAEARRDLNPWSKA